MDWHAASKLLELDHYGGKLIMLAVAALVAYVTQKILSAFLSKLWHATSIPAATIFVNIIKGFIWFLALLAVLDPVFGVKPTAFLAALGVGSVVISLGMQDTVSNLIGGLGLMIGQVVKPGDYITVGSQSGTVEDVTWRNTLVKDSVGSMQVIPNSVLTNTAVKISSAKSLATCSVPLVIATDCDIEEVTKDAIDKGMKALGDAMDPSCEPSLTLSAFTASGITATLSFQLLPDRSTTQCADHVARALVGSSWLAQSSPAPEPDRK